MKTQLTRREFVGRTVLSAAGVWVGSGRRGFGQGPANEKLNLGIIGVAGRGGENLNGVSGENIVALCDVDRTHLEAAGQRFPGATRYRDFRRLLDQKGIDAVVISTPDHTHAVAAVAALRSGRHVYCEKPLARTVSEARMVTETARKERKVTQIGTQIHAGKNYRRVVELIKGGVIGKVREVHVWVNVSYGNVELPKETPVPEHLDYDLWLGPVEYRPYSKDYAPFNWRNFWAFGGGTLADFGCHYMDLPFWALDLKYPRVVEVVDGPPVDAVRTPPWLVVRYEHPRSGSRPALELTWYHGGKQPSRLTKEQAERWKSGVLFVGEKGQVFSDYGRHLLLPEEKFADLVRPEPFIPDSIGHHQEWIQACKGRGKTTCGFDYSGPLTEAALLGNVAFRVGKKLEWNPRKLQAKGCPEAEQFIQHRYREGWGV